MRLDNLFSVNNQFQRSINIVSDFNNDSILDNYIMTPLSIKVMERLLSGLSDQNNQSAWTITGPYGAGKSASLLFIMQLLGRKESKNLQNKLHLFAPDLEQYIINVLPNWPKTLSLIIPLLGSKESIAATFLRGIYKSLSTLDLQGLSKEVNKLKFMLDSYNDGKIINEIELIHIFISCLAKLKNVNHLYSNVVIVIDELGKSLEYASQNISQNDIGVLQLFSELANRSHGYFSLITVLHQAFDRYAEMLNPIQQQEWSKVQGRFENIGFLESNAEILNLLEQAIKRIAHKQDIKAVENVIIEECEDLGLLPGDISSKLGSQILAGCLPLHPVTALLLSRLFRSFFAQNERSLFAFISSQEPFGFQSFLRSNDWDPGLKLPLYRLHNLFDYLTSSFGGSLYTLGTGSKWAEINDALDRLPLDSSEAEINLIKSIGLLELFGDQQSTKASIDILAYSLDLDLDSVKMILAKLLKQKIIVFREFKQAFGFWQGSDINLAEEYTSAFSKIDRSINLSDYLKMINRIDPYVARKHQFTTGTLRFFEPIILNIEDIPDDLDLNSKNIDGGLLIIVLKSKNLSKSEVIDKVELFSKSQISNVLDRSLFLIPSDLQGLREAYEEVLTWQFVKNNTPALESDRIARKELSLYEHNANNKLDLLLSKYFNPALAYQSSLWLYKGKQVFFNSSRELRAKLSEIFDQVFCNSPLIPNELINHNNISGAAAGGRNSLLDKLVNNSDQEDLGIVGYPPEMSIYLSLIKNSGLHHLEEGAWKLCPDTNHDNLRIKPLWQGIHSFLEDNSEKPIAVPSIYNYFRRPPYGLKEGVLPIYLIVALLHWRSQIAVYEENTYIPKITSAICDRLVKAPDRFRIQLFPTSTVYSKLLHKYSKIFNSDIDPNSTSIITAIQPLMEFINRLPKYSFTTSLISPNTKRMRDAIVTAKNPQSLLLKDLPAAFDYSIDGSENDHTSMDRYFDELSFSIFELETSYEKLLNRIKGELAHSLLLSDDISDARGEILNRGHLISQWVSDLSLKSFLLRLSDRNLSDRQWLESIAALLTNIPPRNWSDQEEITYKLQLKSNTLKLKHIEDILLEEGSLNIGYNRKTKPIRIGITDLEGNENSSVLYADDDENELAKNIAQELNIFLSNKSLSKKLILLALSKNLNALLSEDGREQLDHGE